MNCRPGDLAIVIVGPLSAGRIVRVIRLLQPGEKAVSKCGVSLTVEKAPQWLLEGMVFRACGDGVVRLAPVICDRDLRPIRDPGDDARDEMLRPLPQEIAA